MKYKVFTKSGRVYRPKEVEAAFGFVIMTFWHGELRLPAGEILSIQKTVVESAIIPADYPLESKSAGWALPLLLFCVVFVFAFIGLMDLVS